MSQRAEIVYFDRPGPENTDELLGIVAQRVARGDVQYVAVATTSGQTALRAAELIHVPGVQIAAVGFQRKYQARHSRSDETVVQEAQARGVKFMPDQPKAKYWHDVAGESPDSLRKFGEGIQVAVEAVMMAAETGLIPLGAKAIGVGGTGRGADAAAVVTAAGPDNLAQLFVHEVLAKPLSAGGS